MHLCFWCCFLWNSNVFFFQSPFCYCWKKETQTTHGKTQQGWICFQWFTQCLSTSITNVVFCKSPMKWKTWNYWFVSQSRPLKSMWVSEVLTFKTWLNVVAPEASMSHPVFLASQMHASFSCSFHKPWMPNFVTVMFSLNALRKILAASFVILKSVLNHLIQSPLSLLFLYDWCSQFWSISLKNTMFSRINHA